MTRIIVLGVYMVWGHWDKRGFSSYWDSKWDLHQQEARLTELSLWSPSNLVDFRVPISVWIIMTKPYFKENFLKGAYSFLFVHATRQETFVYSENEWTTAMEMEVGKIFQGTDSCFYMEGTRVKAMLCSFDRLLVGLNRVVIKSWSEFPDIR